MKKTIKQFRRNYLLGVSIDQKIKNRIFKNSAMVLFTLFSMSLAYAQPSAPSGKRWQKVGNMSSEFNSFEGSKFQKFSPTWNGRFPGLFQQSNVSNSGGNMKLLSKKFARPVRAHGQNWTHGGAIVTSKNGLYHPQGMYFECRMKGSSSFMSSTFWLKSENRGGSCGTKVFELDVQELIGKVTTKPHNKSWKPGWTKNMTSSTDDQTKCQTVTHANYRRIPMSSPGNKWHTYGVWVVNKDLVRFYLDGKLVNQGKTKIAFDKKLFLRFAVEVYGWNLPEDGNDNMNLSAEKRTTFYDYVRSYKLVNKSSKKTDLKVNDNSVSLQNSLEIYPNPTSDYINIKVNSEVETANIEMYNMLGAKVKSMAIPTNINNNLDVSGLDKGFYIIKSNELNKIIIIK
ncbi:T9SS type A sorting domain-containing protein [uncultured Algibacter sp.]|uniref:T9SS type A sorting domain-containing protein n=1 Tax=uncultured Algibacter sp. TaxID=298659 RepID=UPI0032171658